MIVLDLGLPLLDGIEICRRLREAGDRTPILMLTARDAVEDRVAGLEAGADDYLVKPYDVRELRARLRAIIRRHLEGADGRSLHFEGLELDADAHAARIGGRAIELTRTEYQLLELFMLNPRRVLTAELIYDRVWGYDASLADELAARVHRVPAPQARGRRRAAADPDGARRRLRAAPGPMSLRSRIALAAAVSVAAVSLVLGAIGYLGTRARLFAEVRQELRHAGRAVSRRSRRAGRTRTTNGRRPPQRAGGGQVCAQPGDRARPAIPRSAGRRLLPVGLPRRPGGRR